MNAQYQDNEKAPTKRGIWAFPFPYVELFFVGHRLDKGCKPKRLWYNGKFYCHFHPVNHECVGQYDWYEWANLREFAKLCEKHAGASKYYDDLEIFIPM